MSTLAKTPQFTLVHLRWNAAHRRHIRHPTRRCPLQDEILHLQTFRIGRWKVQQSCCNRTGIPTPLERYCFQRRSHRARVRYPPLVNVGLKAVQTGSLHWSQVRTSSRRYRCRTCTSMVPWQSHTPSFQLLNRIRMIGLPRGRLEHSFELRTASNADAPS